MLQLTNCPIYLCYLLERQRIAVNLSQTFSVVFANVVHFAALRKHCRVNWWLCLVHFIPHRRHITQYLFRCICICIFKCDLKTHTVYVIHIESHWLHLFGTSPNTYSVAFVWPHCAFSNVISKRIHIESHWLHLFDGLTQYVFQC